MVFASVAALAQDEAIFDFQANPWGHALGSGSGETADAGNITEALLADDGATSISFDQGAAQTTSRFWTGPQVRAYKGSSATITAAEGKSITQIVVVATGATYVGIANEGVTTSGAEAIIAFDEPVSSYTLNISTTTRWTKIKVSYGEPAQSVDITNTPETAYSVSKANELIKAGEGLNASVYVSGKISEIEEIAPSFGNATYTITDGSEVIKVYRGFGIDGAKFESNDALHVGDDVIVYGNLINYNGTYEVAQGNKLYSLECNNVEPEAPAVNLEVTYVPQNNMLVLTYPDYISGAVEPGKGNPEIWNEVMKVAEGIDGQYGQEYNQVYYNISTTLAPGTYVLKVGEGVVAGNMTDAFGSVSPIGAAEARFEVVAAEGGDDVADNFGAPLFEVLSGSGINVKFTFPESTDKYNKGSNETAVTLYEDGVEVATANFGFQMDPTFFYGVHFDYEAKAGKEYKVVFPAGAWYLYTENQNGVQTTVEESAEQTYTWTAEAGESGEEPGDQPSEGGWVFPSVTPAQGNVESLHDLTFAYPSGVMWANESVTVDIVGDNEVTAKVMLFDNFAGACTGTVLDQTLKTPGTYTMTIPASSFTDQAGNPSAEMTFTWTIPGEEGGETPETPGDVTGKKWQEKVFSQGTAVAIPLNIDTDGVTITSVGRAFMDTTIDVSYNMYEEGELDWKNGTKLVFTAKDNITGIVIDGQFKEFAEADKGTYNNGAWTGTLAAGETLTLTANDGINIHSITVLYNGAELGVEDVEDVEATITFDITKTSWAKIGAMNGESIGTVSTDLKNFDHYMFMITNDDDPAQVITFADLLTIEGEMKCYSPDANGYDLYNGQNYTLHIYAYDTPQYGAFAAAEAEYHFVGTGKEGIVYNEDITVLGVSLKVNAQGLGYNLNGTQFDVMFSAPVASVKAWWAKGFEGATNFSAVKKSDDGTVWTIIMDESVTTAEGAINVNITAKDAEGHQLRLACDNFPYAIDVVVSPEPEPEPEIANLDFTAGAACTSNVRTYAKDIVDNDVAQLQEIEGWTIVENGDARAAAVFAYGSENFLGGVGYSAPAAGPNGEAGLALGIEAVWMGNSQYVQNVTLPAGNYVITMPTYNSVGGTQAIAKNLFGFIAEDGTEYLASEKTWAANKWTNMVISFTLTEETAGKLSLGYTAANTGNANMPHLFIDCVNIETVSALDLAKSEALTKLPAADESIFTPAPAEVEAIKSAIECAGSVEEVEILVSSIANLSIPALDGVYNIMNVNGQNYLGEAVLSAEPVDITFEKAEGGYYIKMGDNYLNMLGTNNWSMTAAPEATTAWNFNLADGVYTISGPKGMIGSDATESGSAVYGDKNASKNGTWTIEAVVPEVTVATLTIGEEVINLSETKAVLLAEYPADAVLTLTNDDAAIKKVTYEVVDNTKCEILKSQGDLAKNEEGAWTASMPRTYVLAAGHDYSIHVKALNGMSSFTSTVLYEYNFRLVGTSGVKDYSTIKLASVSPAENEIITDKEPVITFTFDAPIASLTSTVNQSQMVTPSIPAENISSNEDKTVWTVKVPESFMSYSGIGGALSLNIAALDANGDYVYDADFSVGTPENSYMSFDWATTVGLPTPELAENGKELDEVTSITFTYEGIGLNQDKTTATWQNIEVIKDGIDLNYEFTEDMFAVSGNESVGGTKLTLTFPSALKAGSYVVRVPAMAFMLGHDNSNYANGAAEYTFTVKGSVPEIALNITKTDWSKIGSDNGEVIGTAELKNAEAFDHFEAEIFCAEDPDQYITFANLNVNGGNLTCYCWEGGSYTLNKDYHYTIIVKAFDAPYYGLLPVATATYEFVGTGAEAVKYCDIQVAEVSLKENPLLYHGYDVDGQTFDVTFSEPVSKVVAWMAMGFDGAKSIEAAKKSEDGKVWTITLPESVLADEGSINVMFQAWNAEGVQAKGENGDHAFDLNIIVTLVDDPDAIENIIAKFGAESTVYTTTGARIKANMMKRGNIYIIRGKKVLVK